LNSKIRISTQQNRYLGSTVNKNPMKIQFKIRSPRRKASITNN